MQRRGWLLAGSIDGWCKLSCRYVNSLQVVDIDNVKLACRRMEVCSENWTYYADQSFVSPTKCSHIFIPGLEASKDWNYRDSGKIFFWEDFVPFPTILHARTEELHMRYFEANRRKKTRSSDACPVRWSRKHENVEGSFLFQFLLLQMESFDKIYIKRLSNICYC